MTEHELELLLSEPNERLGHALARLTSPLLILGANGKMGPTLALLAKRSLALVGKEIEVLAVSRFSDPEGEQWFRNHGIRTIGCDLLEREEVKRLPDSNNIIYMAGRKFGTQDTPSLTWAMNTLPPLYVCERYPAARFVALSSGSVYPMVSVTTNGSTEDSLLTPPGEYANACVARERIFEYCSQKNNTKVVLIRLNYAIEPRYGVLVDIARKILEGEPVDVTMGYFNCIWQRDANDMILRSFDFASSPPRSMNLTGEAKLSVRSVATAFGKVFGIEPVFRGIEADNALLNDASTTLKALGKPSTTIDEAIELTAAWFKSGHRILDKPTHFEVRDGTY